MALPVAVAVVVALSLGWGWALFLALFLYVADAGAWQGLLKYFSFSDVHSFLILFSTNLSGLGSGWLLAFLLHPKS